MLDSLSTKFLEGCLAPVYGKFCEDSIVIVQITDLTTLRLLALSGLEGLVSAQHRERIFSEESVADRQSFYPRLPSYVAVMRALIFFAAIAPLISPLLATAIPKYNKRDTGLKVVLSQVRATEVNAVMENTGTEALKLLDYGTLMDKNPIQKLNVFKDGENKFPIVHFIYTERRP